MLNKYKRYRERAKEGRVGVKVEFQVTLKRLGGLPRSLGEVKVSLRRDGKTIPFPEGQMSIGTVRWTEAVCVVCTVYRDAVQADVCEPKEFEVVVSGRGSVRGNTFKGDAAFDIASCAFKGAAEQKFQLTIPLAASDTWQGGEPPTSALAELSILGTVVGDLAETRSRQVSMTAQPAVSVREPIPTPDDVSIASGLSSEGSHHELPDTSRRPSARQMESQTDSSPADSVNLDKQARAKQRRQRPAGLDGSKSATRISNAQRKLKERALLLSKTVKTTLRRTKSLTTASSASADSPHTDEAVQNDAETEDSQRAQLFAATKKAGKSRPKKAQRSSPSANESLSESGGFDTAQAPVRKPQAEEGASTAPAISLTASSGQSVSAASRQPERRSESHGHTQKTQRKLRKPESNGDISLDLETLDIPSVPSSVGEGNETHNDHEEGDEDESEEVQDGKTAEGFFPPKVRKEQRLKQVDRSGSLMANAMSLWEKGWTALKPDKTARRTSSRVSREVKPKLAEIDLRTPSNIVKTFGRGSETVAAATRKPVPDLPEAQLPYSESSSQSEPETNDQFQDWPNSEGRDQQHMQQVFEAATTLRSQRLSLQSTPQIPRQNDSSEGDGDAPDSAPVSKTDRSKVTGEPAGRLKKILSASRRPLRLKRLQDAARKKSQAVQDEDSPETHPEKQPPEGKTADASTDPKTEVKQTVDSVSSQQLEVKIRVARITEEAIKIAAAMKEQSSLAGRRVDNNVSMIRRTVDLDESASKDRRSSMLEVTASGKNTGMPASSMEGSAYALSPRSWGLGKDGRRVKELQLELKLARERIAVLESNRWSPMNSPLAMDFRAGQTAFSRGTKAKEDGSSLGSGLAASREQSLSDQLQQVRKLLVELQIHLASADPTPGNLVGMQACVTAASSHAAKAKEVSELIKSDMLGSGVLPVTPQSAMSYERITSHQQAEAERLTSELRLVRESVHSKDKQIEDLQLERQSLQTKLQDAQEQQDSWTRLAQSEREDNSAKLMALNVEASSMREAEQRHKRQLGTLEEMLGRLEVGKGLELLQGFDRVVAQLQGLLDRHSALQDDNARLLQAPPVLKQPGVVNRRIAELERELAERTLAIEQLQQEVEEARADTAVEMQEAEHARLLEQYEQRIQELEAEAQSELESMHAELLTLREANHAMQASLRDSQARRSEMQAKVGMMEQQLQETAGELVDAERRLTTISSQRSDRFRRSTSNAKEAAHIVMPGGHLVSVDSIRRDYGAMMQELVQRKLELAELSENYELVCHAFLKADETKNAPILEKLKQSGMVVPSGISIKIDAR